MRKNMAKTWLGRGVMVAAIAAAVTVSVPGTASAAVHTGHWRETQEEAQADLDNFILECQHAGGRVNTEYVDSGNGFRAYIDCSTW